MLRRNLLRICVIVALAFAVVAVGSLPTLAASTGLRFVHPSSEDTIPAGRTVKVTAVAFGAEMPEDTTITAVLAFDGPADITVSNLEIHGRAITADLLVTGNAGAGIQLNVFSPSLQLGGHSLTVYLE